MTLLAMPERDIVWILLQCDKLTVRGNGEPHFKDRIAYSSHYEAFLPWISSNYFLFS
jgi:hypothetical protein